MQSVVNKVLNRIHGHGSGWAFTPADFLDLGTRASVDQALSRLAKAGTIRRLRRGLYDFPRRSQRLGVLSPNPDSIARAVAARSNSRIQPSGAFVANLLGLSTQVPARPVFFTDGPSKRIQLGHQTIQLKHRSPAHFATDGAAGMALQALRYLGKSGVNDSVVMKLRTRLRGSDKKKLQKTVHYIPSWMVPHIKDIVREQTTAHV